MVNAIFGPSSNVKIEFRLSKCDNQSSLDCKKYECQNAIFGPNLNVKVGFRMSKFDIRPLFECQNRISNVKMRYLARIK